MQVQVQVPIQVIYDGVNVGNYVSDILVEEKVLIELKAVDNLTNTHLAQCLNYLTATKLRLCLLINFGKPRVEIRRVTR
jgi:GxxExxY protein